jgi:hypothetical protein
MEDLQNETIPQVHVMVDIYVEQQFGDILDDLNDSNFCGSASSSTSVGHVSSLSITIDANVSTTIVRHYGQCW